MAPRRAAGGTNTVLRARLQASIAAPPRKRFTPDLRLLIVVSVSSYAADPDGE